MPLIFCINLDDRKDRWETIKKMGDDVGIQIIRLPGVKADEGWKGCSLSHVKACNIAKMLDLPWVLVLEDDCQFTKEAWDRFVSYLPVLWRRRADWNYFNGGPTYISWICPWDKDARLASGHALTLHFALYNKNVYDTILNWKEADYVLDYSLRNKSRCIFAQQMIATQRPSYSDIEKTVKDYTWIFDMFTKKLEPIFDIIFKDGFVGQIPNCDTLTPTT